MDSDVTFAGGGGGRGKRKELKADEVPEGPRPNLSTVPEADSTEEEEIQSDVGESGDYSRQKQTLPYLFIRVLRARNLIGKQNDGLNDPYVRISVGPLKMETMIISQTLHPEWNQDFVIGEDKIQGGVCELSVWGADKRSEDNFLGGFTIDLDEVPTQESSESQVAPQWYKLQSKTRKGRVGGDLMVAIWWGLQDDELFPPQAWHNDPGPESTYAPRVPSACFPLYREPPIYHEDASISSARFPPLRKAGPSVPYVGASRGPFARALPDPFTSESGVTSYAYDYDAYETSYAGAHDVSSGGVHQDIPSGGVHQDVPSRGARRVPSLGVRRVKSFVARRVPSEGTPGVPFAGAPPVLLASPPMPDRHGLIPAWRFHLTRAGNCKFLYTLLKCYPRLVCEKGEHNFTVLHKAVRNGHVMLVKHILVDLFNEKGKCVVGDVPGNFTRGKLLKTPTSTGLTAVQIALMTGNPKIVMLLEWAIVLSDEIIPAAMLDRLENDFPDRNCDPVDPPNVNDNGIDGPVGSCYEEEERKRVEEVYEILAGLDTETFDLPEGASDDESRHYDDAPANVLGILRDFAFVPSFKHVFLHYLICNSNTSSELRQKFEMYLKTAVEQCRAKGLGYVGTLYNLHDPQGRTLFHVALEYDNKETWDALWNAIPEDDLQSVKRCVNARDAAGRTVLHAFIISRSLNNSVHRSRSIQMKKHLDREKLFKEKKNLEDSPSEMNAPSQPIMEMNLKPSLKPHLDVNAFLEPISKSWNTLAEWSSSKLGLRSYTYTPLQLAILHDATPMVKFLLTFKSECDVNLSWVEKDRVPGLPAAMDEYSRDLRPLQMAAILGRTNSLDLLLQRSDISDIGFSHEKDKTLAYIPALHCAAMYCQLEAIQTFLKLRRRYDPLIQTHSLGSALHAILNPVSLNHLEACKVDALLHSLPCTHQYTKGKFTTSDSFHENGTSERYFSGKKINCIDLLIESGSIDIWTPHKGNDNFPSPDSRADDDALRWWYEKMTNERTNAKKNINDGANATGIIAALVATASFIGPFQPPLGYDQSSDGYIHTEQVGVRVYLVCNGLAFFFAVACIMIMAIILAIPMPKEPFHSEFKRSRVCLRCAALMLLLSIICLLISFSAASMAVVSTDWNKRRLVVLYVGLGGGVCIIVVLVYIILLCEMMFNRINNRIKTNISH